MRHRRVFCLLTRSAKTGGETPPLRYIVGLGTLLASWGAKLPFSSFSSMACAARPKTRPKKADRRKKQESTPKKQRTTHFQPLHHQNSRSERNFRPSPFYRRVENRKKGIKPPKNPPKKQICSTWNTPKARKKRVFHVEQRKNRGNSKKNCKKTALMRHKGEREEKGGKPFS